MPRTSTASDTPGLLAKGVRPTSPGVEARRDTPVPTSLRAARALAADCTRCPLYLNATQTVFGEGPSRASLMLVGEQPGDQEDLSGHVFVGPAGKVLDRALLAAGIERKAVYITNGVKHFKNEPRGKRRLHKRPDVHEIDVCRWWLDLELRFVKPKVVVAMGATAVRAITGKSASITSLRDRPTQLGSAQLHVTVHPSFLLRLPDRAAAAVEYERFVADLARASKAAA